MSLPVAGELGLLSENEYAPILQSHYPHLDGLSQDETLGQKVKWTQSNNPNKGAPGKKAQERAAERAQREADRLEAEAAAKVEAAEAAARAKEEAAAAAEAAKNAPAAEEAPAEEAPAAEATEDKAEG